MSEREAFPAKKKPPPPRDLVSANNLVREDIDRIFHLAQNYRETMRSSEVRRLDDLRDCIVYLAFMEPSTRTRTSFAFAAFRLGATVFTHETPGVASSAAKGESFEDTLAVINRYGADAVVIRHPTKGMAARAAELLDAPVINAGDGDGEHPTQALMDLFTILHPVNVRRPIDDVKMRVMSEAPRTVVLCGDLKYGRTVHSLCLLTTRYWPNGDGPIRFIFCSPEALRMSPDIRDTLTAANVPFDETDDLDRAVRDADVFYQTRVQLERMNGGKEDAKGMNDAKERFRLEARHLEILKPTGIIMHPMPIVNEIERESVDRDPRARYLNEQIDNSVYVRMALLRWALRPDRDVRHDSQP